MEAFDTARSAFRDPDLCLITSARLLTIQQVGQQLYQNHQYVLHRLIFQKEFSTLLKVFKGMSHAIAGVIDEVDA